MLMTIAEYLKPLMPYSVIITLIGFIITWIYKKKQDKREYQPRIYIENHISFRIEDINVVEDNVYPIKFIIDDNEERYDQLIKVTNLGKKEAKNIEFEWHIEDIEKLIDEINSYFKKTKANREWALTPKDEKNPRYIVSNYTSPKYNYSCPHRLNFIHSNNCTDTAINIKLDNSYIYLVCLLIYLRKKSLPPGGDILTKEYHDRKYRILDHLPASILNISYQDIYDKDYNISFKLTPKCGYDVIGSEKSSVPTCCLFFKFEIKKYSGSKKTKLWQMAIRKISRRRSQNS